MSCQGGCESYGQTDQRRSVFVDDGKQRGVFAQPEFLPQAFIAHIFFEFFQRNKKWNSFETSRRQEYDVIPQRVFQMDRVDEVHYALIYRDTAAQSKNENGNYQSPKIKFFAITKGMILVGWFLAALETQQ